MNPTWTLNGLTAVGTPDLPPCEVQSLVWRGAWQPIVIYFANEIVSSEGAAWIATKMVSGVKPGEGEGWDLLAAAGEPGPAGEQGPPGPPGPPGEPGSFAGQSKKRFNRRGVARVSDQRIEGSSVIVIQYADARRKGRLRPTNVTQVGDGFFVARGHPRTRFNYVIHPAP